MIQPSLRLRLIVLLVSAIVGILLLEGMLRLRQYFKYGSAKNSLYEMVYDPVSRLEIPKPNQVTRTIRIDSRGFRNSELQMPKPADTIRLAFIGASTTFCAEVSSNEATWPHLVWQTLQSARPDVRFDYINAGVPGYVVESSIRNLQYRVSPLVPDVIVIYDAVNDLSRDTRELAMKQGIQRGSVDDSSGLSRWLLTWSLLEKNFRLFERQKAVGRHELHFDPSTLSAGFHRRLLRLVKEAQQVAPVVAIATFSQKVRRDQDAATQLRNANTHLYYMPYLSIDSILKGFDEYNRIIRTVAAETGIILIDGEDRIPGDDVHFNDSVHFKDAGSVLMAARVSQALLQARSMEELTRGRRLTATLRPFFAPSAVQKESPTNRRQH